MFRELDRMKTLLHPYNLLWMLVISSFCMRSCWDDGLAVGEVIDFAGADLVSQSPVPMIVHHWAYWLVDGDLLPVYAKT